MLTTRQPRVTVCSSTARRASSARTFACRRKAEAARFGVAASGGAAAQDGARWRRRAWPWPWRPSQLPHWPCHGLPFPGRPAPAHPRPPSSSNPLGGSGPSSLSAAAGSCVPTPVTESAIQRRGRSKHRPTATGPPVWPSWRAPVSSRETSGALIAPCLLSPTSLPGGLHTQLHILLRRGPQARQALGKLSSAASRWCAAGHPTARERVGSMIRLHAPPSS